MPAPNGNGRLSQDSWIRVSLVIAIVAAAAALAYRLGVIETTLKFMKD